MRTQFVFFRERCTLMVEMESTIFSSTSLSARSRTVQRWYPAGAFEQARAVRRASKAPSKVASRGLRCALRASAASNPSSTKRCLRCSTAREVTPTAEATSATFPRSPSSPASHNSRARAYTNFAAVDLPLRVCSVSCSRSVFVRVTLYRLAMPEQTPDSQYLQYEIHGVTWY